MMDPRGNIYEDDPEKISDEDKARLEGFLKGRAEAGLDAHERLLLDIMLGKGSEMSEETVAVELTREEIAALHFHYTKNGIPATQTAAVALAAKLRAALDQDGAER